MEFITLGISKIDTNYYIIAMETEQHNIIELDCGSYYKIQNQLQWQVGYVTKSEDIQDMKGNDRIIYKATGNKLNKNSNEFCKFVFNAKSSYPEIALNNFKFEYFVVRVKRLIDIICESENLFVQLYIRNYKQMISVQMNDLKWLNYWSSLKGEDFETKKVKFVDLINKFNKECYMVLRQTSKLSCVSFISF